MHLPFLVGKQMLVQATGGLAYWRGAHFGERQGQHHPELLGCRSRHCRHLSCCCRCRCRCRCLSCCCLSCCCLSCCCLSCCLTSQRSRHRINWSHYRMSWSRLRSHRCCSSWRETPLQHLRACLRLPLLFGQMWGAGVCVCAFVSLWEGQSVGRRCGCVFVCE